MFVGLLIEAWEVSLAWGQNIKLGVGGNYVCWLAIVVIVMGLGGEKRGFKVIICREQRTSHKEGWGNSYGWELVSQLVYLNYLPISASFGLKRVLWYSLHNVPIC